MATKRSGKPWPVPLIRDLVRKRGFDIVRYPISEAGFKLTELLAGFGISLVLDVGANLGQYGTELRRFGYQGRIVSFEPVKEAFKELCRNSSEDAGWSAVCHGLGDRQETLHINVAGNKAASSSVLPMNDVHIAAAPHAAYVRREKAQFFRLADIWSDYVQSDDRTFLKIDTQGYEGAILDGALPVLKECIGVQLELSFAPLYEGGMLQGEAIRRMEDLGFSVISLEPVFTDPRTRRLLQMDGVFFRV